MTENGSLPDGWMWTTLGEATRPLQKRVNPQHYENLPYIGMENIEAHTMRLLGTVSAKDMKSTADTFTAGDVLYGRLRPYLNKVFCPDFDGLCSTEFIVFRKAPNLYSKYLQYFLNSWEFVTFSNSLNAGDRPRVKFEQLSNYPFPLPPLPEQERIVAKIEALFTQLDAGTAALRRIQAELKRYKASVLKAACEGRLVATELELACQEEWSYEIGEDRLKHILTERRRKWEEERKKKGKAPSKLKYDEPNSPEIERLPNLPKSWCWATVEQIGNINEQPVLTGPFGADLGRDDFIEKGVPVLTIGCLTEQGLTLDKAKYVIEDKAKALGKYRVAEGDILFSRMATVGRAGLVEKPFNGCLINYHLMRLRLTKDIIEPNYFIAYVRGSKVVKDFVRDVNHGATRDGINTQQLLSLPVPIPPLNEQIRIIEEIDRIFSIIFQIEKLINKNLEQSKSLRQSILKKAFEGRLLSQPQSLTPGENTQYGMPENVFPAA